MLKNVFRKRAKKVIEELYSPLSGEVISLEHVPDPVFAQKMMGDGLAIIPSSGKVVSPTNGKIVKIFPTKHAIGLLSDKGLEILIHIGLDTVELNGEGFEVFVQNGQIVKIGEPLLKVDLEYLERKNKEIVTPVIITNILEKVENLEYAAHHVVTKGEILLTCHVKMWEKESF
ncbi:PTS glucose transporter subunit IIA [Bacillus smithii]|uniref:PTS sugar transporter subunit IIA n=1 Tax=Bacillus smithii TaxID=1479 RepID=UPI0030C98F38